MRKCYKCKRRLPMTPTNFGRDASRVGGFEFICKECKKTQTYYNNPEHRRRGYLRNKAAIKTRNRKRYWDTRSESLARVKAYAGRNKEKIRKRQKEYQKKYWAKNSKKIISLKQLRLKRDAGARAVSNLRSRISYLIKTRNGQKKGGFYELTGCSREFLCGYLEGKFRDGMTWENYGEWHVDHIRPCCSFDMTSKQQQKECFNYKNLQPLWAEENLRKGGEQETKNA